MARCTVVLLASALTISSCGSGETQVNILSAQLDSPAVLAFEIGACAGGESRLEVSETERRSWSWHSPFRSEAMRTAQLRDSR